MHEPRDASLTSRLADFVQYRRTYLTGDEKGEAQVYCERLFRAFGHDGVREAGATLEMRIRRRDARGTAFADLMWKPNCLIEMKKHKTDLRRHYRQAFDYWERAVPNRPRYVVLCNFDEFWVYDFDLQLDEPVDIVKLDDLPRRWDALAFLCPEPTKPVFGNDLVAVTREAAAQMAALFTALRERAIDRIDAQRFVLQSVVAMFAEDVGLLPHKLFSQTLASAETGSEAYDLIFGLFNAMNTPGETPSGRFRGTPYFNGGIFEQILPIELVSEELQLLRFASSTDWSAVRPEIFGTLFERSMDHGERHAHGAHFTSQADIARVVGPTVVAPWRDRISVAGTIAELQKVLADMYRYRVLDPACGSGNFLYVAYREMRRLEHEVSTLIAERSRSRQRPLTYLSSDNFLGIDVNPFAVEVAKVTMMLGKKLSADELDDDEQVLPLQNLNLNIVAADALFTEWPKVDAIIGNPPYLGRQKMIEELGAPYNDRLKSKYPEVGGTSDFVCYWFPLAHKALPLGGRAGLVATKSVRETSSRKASLDYIVNHGGVIFDAVSTQPWYGDAVVHVSIVNWAKGVDPSPKILWLNQGQLRLEVEHIPTMLTLDVDIAEAHQLTETVRGGGCYQGQTPGITEGGFVLTEKEKQQLVGSRYCEFVHPYLGGYALLHRLAPDRYIIDLPHNDAVEARLAAPTLIGHLEKKVLRERQKAADKEAQQNAERLSANAVQSVATPRADFLRTWWKLWRRRADMLDAIGTKDRYIAVSRVSSWERPTVFTFVDSTVRLGDSAVAFAMDDDYSFGILHSSLHRAWFEGRCSRLKADLRYTNSTVFYSFPWPQAPTNSKVAGIVDTVNDILALRADYLEQGVSLARQYDTLRQPGQSKLRTLHKLLDEAVYAAYEFSFDDDALIQLLALNQDIAADPHNARSPGAEGLLNARKSTYRLTPNQ